MKRFAILLCGLTALPAAAQEHRTNADDRSWNCDKPMVQQEMNYCAHQDYLAADQLLNVQWERTAAIMHLRDENWDIYLQDENREAPYSERPGYFETMLEAQRAWITFRDAHCASAGDLYRGGSIQPLFVATCKTELTERRTAQLRQLESLE